MGKILVGVLFLLIGSCNGLQAFGDRNMNAAVGGGMIAIILILIGVALLVSGYKNYSTPAINKSSLKKCPFCAEMVKKDAILCRYCGKNMPENIPS